MLSRINLWAVVWKSDGAVLVYGAQIPVVFFSRAQAERWKYNSAYKTIKVMKYVPGKMK